MLFDLIAQGVGMQLASRNHGRWVGVTEKLLALHPLSVTAREISLLFQHNHCSALTRPSFTHPFIFSSLDCCLRALSVAFSFGFDIHATCKP